MVEHYQRGEPRVPDDIRHELMEMSLVGRELTLSYDLEIDRLALDSMLVEFMAWRARQRASQPLTKEQVILGVLAPVRLGIASAHWLLTRQKQKPLTRAQQFDAFHSIQIRTSWEGIVRAEDSDGDMVQFPIHGQRPSDTIGGLLYDLASFVVLPKARKLGLGLPFSCAMRSDEDVTLALIFEADAFDLDTVAQQPPVPYCRWADIAMVPYATRVQADFDTGRRVLRRHRVFDASGGQLIDLRLCRDQT
ncbi:MAG: hypothetical protein ACP5HZ_04145 [Ferrimicrobium sp.]|uniref:hypothetical protein n=1 Tax=Ferrimicrobium sp. TaxID=2926050 RepID=UPI0026212032|nr:hypothetical protein [Ferrimicrobium sp.]